MRSRLTVGGAVYDDDTVISLTIRRGATPDTGFALGATTAAQLDVALFDLDGTMDLSAFAGVDIVPEIGLVLPDDSVEYVSQGIFTADQPTRSEGKIALTAYDRMIRLEKAYQPPFTPPATAAALLEEVTTQAGVPLASGYASLPNMGMPITQEISGGTLRQIIGWVAELAGGFAWINRAGVLEIRQFTTAAAAVAEITPDNYFPPMTVADEAFWVDGLIVKSTAEDVGLTYGNEPQRPWSIIGNPLMVDFPAPAANTLLSALSVIEYWSYNVAWQGDPALDPGDALGITDYKTNVRRLSIVGTEVLTYTGGLRSQIALTAPSAYEQATSTQVSASTVSSMVTRSWSEIQRNAEQIALKVSQTTYDGEKPHVGGPPPEVPPVGRLWLDTSVTPNLLKRWDGTAWVAAGAEAVKASGIDISAGKLYAYSADVAFDTQNFAVNIKDPNDQDLSRVSIDDNGISAERVNADALYSGPQYINNAMPSLVGARATRLPPGVYDIYVWPTGNDNNSGIGGWANAKRTIASALESLPKHLDGATVRIWLYSGVNYGEDVLLDGYYGSGSITIGKGAIDAHVQVRTLRITQCSVPVTVYGVISGNVRISQCGNVLLDNCAVAVAGTGNNGIDVINASNVRVRGTEINAYHGMWLNDNSSAYAESTRGDCTYAYVVRDGSVMHVLGTRPYGTISTDAVAEVRGSASEAHGSGYTPPPTPPTQTVQVALADSRSYRASPDNQWYADRLVGYGRWAPNGIWTGCMRFDLSSLAGKTVLRARIRLMRRNGVGSSSAETITVQTYTSPATLPGGNTSGNAPVRGGTGASATIPRGVATWMDISPADVQAIINGGAVGLAINTGNTGYGKCDGVGDATPPILEVTYQ
ncbi:MAG: hypothetical protein PHO66_05100 [Eubacteriales bacterium]|nr:hypothetical protein [Eubacteriales bacterium]